MRKINPYKQGFFQTICAAKIELTQKHPILRKLFIHTPPWFFRICANKAQMIEKTKKSISGPDANAPSAHLRPYRAGLTPFKHSTGAFVGVTLDSHRLSAGAYCAHAAKKQSRRPLGLSLRFKLLFHRKKIYTPHFCNPRLTLIQLKKTAQRTEYERCH